MRAGLRTTSILSLWVAIGASGCPFRIPEGLACDGTHACPAEQRCVAGRCRSGLDAGAPLLDAPPLDAPRLDAPLLDVASPDADGPDAPSPDAPGPGRTFTEHVYNPGGGATRSVVHDGASLSLAGLAGSDLVACYPARGECNVMEAPFDPAMSRWRTMSTVIAATTGRPVLGPVGRMAQPGLAFPTGGDPGISFMWREGTLMGPMAVGSPGPFVALATGLLDANPVADFVYVRPSSGDVEVLFRSATGSTSATAFALASPVTRVAVGDFDADGDQDVAMAPTTNGVSLGQNDGAGSLTAWSAATLAGETFRALRAGASLNGSGRAEAIFCAEVGSSGTSRVRSVLSPAVDVVVPGVCVDLAVGDLVGDGAPDVAVLSSDRVVFLVNDGAGALSVGPAVTTSGVASSLAALDFDADGDLDLAIGTEASGLLLLEQR